MNLLLFFHYLHRASMPLPFTINSVYSCQLCFKSYNNKNLILDVGMEKEQKQELECRVSTLPIPASFHCILCKCNITTNG